MNKFKRKALALAMMEAPLVEPRDCATCHHHKLDEEGDSICHHPVTQNSYPEGATKFVAMKLFCRDFKLWRKK